MKEADLILQEVVAQMVAEIQVAAERKAVKKQRTLQATPEVREVQSTAHQLTLGQSCKRKASNELDTAIADLVHAERLPHGFEASGLWGTGTQLG